MVDVVATLGYQNATSSGTGIVLTPSGEVLTSNHVIDGATSVKVRDIGNGRICTATVAGYDESRDIAVLQLKGASGLATATLGDSSAVRSGQKIVAVGNAGGQDGTPAVATGKVTGLRKSITASDESAGTSERLQGLIRTSAGIEAGDSGGPLINARGQVIGLNTAASADSGDQLTSSTATQAYTIPVNGAAAIASQIRSGQFLSHGPHRLHRVPGHRDRLSGHHFAGRGTGRPGGHRGGHCRGRAGLGCCPGWPDGRRRDHLARRPPHYRAVAAPLSAEPVPSWRQGQHHLDGSGRPPAQRQPHPHHRPGRMTGRAG